MKQDKKTTNKSGCTAVLAAAMIAAGGFSAYAGNQGTHGGEWKDTESLRWEWQNGEMSFYGNGSIFFLSATAYAGAAFSMPKGWKAPTRLWYTMENI